MRIEQLRSFIWLVKVKSFTQAAEKLHMSTSALSKSIKSLEEEVGKPLINRETTPLSLTQVGQEFYQFAIGASSEYEYFIQKYRKDRPVCFENIRVYSMPGVDQLYAMEAIAKTATKYPNVEFIHSSRTAFSVFSELLAQESSVLVVPDFEFTAALYQDFEIHDLPPIAYGSYCRARHPILERGEVLFSDLWDFSVCGPSLPPEVEQLIVEQVGREKLQRRPLFNLYYEHVSSVHKTLFETNMIAVGVPQKEMEPYVASGRLRQIPVAPHLFQQINAKLLVNKEANRSAALSTLIENIKSTAIESFI